MRADQLAAVRSALTVALPVNMLIGLGGAIVAAHAGRTVEAALWFLASLGVNLLRLALCRISLPLLPGEDEGVAVDRSLRVLWLAALLSGAVWATQATLTDGFTSPETLFFLTALCGVTAGAVTRGTAYARVPMAFMTPPLVSAALVIGAGGTLDREVLAAAIVVYLLALTRSAVQSEALFREASRAKHAATMLAASLAEANRRSAAVATQMARRAAHDPLTEILNRAGFLHEAEQRIAEGAGSRCLMLVDLDGFKLVNDCFGHALGDRVLIEVAQRLRGLLPRDAVLARLGGDEFAVFWTPRDGAEPRRLAEGVIAAIGQPFEGLEAGRIGASVGIHDDPTLALTDLLACADAALYAAKETGRNRACLFDEGLRRTVAMRRQIERDLPRALERGELAVWFQPIYGEGGRALAGFEALVRWRHAKLGWVSPPDLVAAAATTGMSQPLLGFIMERACAFQTTLRAFGRDDVHVALNVSPREMMQLPVDEMLLSAIGAAGLPPASFEVEITEETAMDLAAVRLKLATLRRAGVRIAVDDFGVGFSSLASLRHLRPDRVKIDRCFVTGMGQSEDDRTLVDAILGLGRALRFEVVAEGVETADDLAALRAAGCRYMQGYHLGRPAPPETLLTQLRTLYGKAA